VPEMMTLVALGVFRLMERGDAELCAREERAWRG
jgi:hypothetical protein